MHSWDRRLLDGTIGQRRENGNKEIRVKSAHAKISAFHGSDHVDLFWGSANLSYRAWMAKGRSGER